MQVVIFGGGVAGLTTAAALLAGGVPARVYERLPSGTTNGQGFILSPQARLLKALLDHLPSQVVTPRAELTRLRLGAAGTATHATLAPDPGQPVHADLFVGADGVGSLTRRTLFPHWPRRRSRVWEVVAIVQDGEVSRWAGEDFHKFSAPGVAAGLVPVGGQRVVWFVHFDRERFPVPANAGPGPGMPPAAIAGARDLATALSRHRSLEAALAAYSAACRARCAPYLDQGRQLTRQFLHPEGRAGDRLPMST